MFEVTETRRKPLQEERGRRNPNTDPGCDRSVRDGYSNDVAFSACRHCAERAPAWGSCPLITVVPSSFCKVFSVPSLSPCAGQMPPSVHGNRLPRHPLRSRGRQEEDHVGNPVGLAGSSQRMGLA
jgi:hypothetical protein